MSCPQSVSGAISIGGHLAFEVLGCLNANGFICSLIQVEGIVWWAWFSGLVLGTWGAWYICGSTSVRMIWSLAAKVVRWNAQILINLAIHLWYPFQVECQFVQKQCTVLPGVRFTHHKLPNIFTQQKIKKTYLKVKLWLNNNQHKKRNQAPQVGSHSQFKRLPLSIIDWH